jgi:hypothetical protein
VATVAPEHQHDRPRDRASFHITGPSENGWVINVVSSGEQFETFAREQLLPAAQQAGDAPPQVTFFLTAEEYGHRCPNN